MAEKMVRTQVYLPRVVYDRLQRRAEKHGMTLAMQIRAALDEYMERVEAEDDDGILRADDPIFQMIGLFDSGLDDLAENHDRYLYGDLHQERPPPVHAPSALERKPARPREGVAVKEQHETAYKARQGARKRRSP